MNKILEEDLRIIANGNLPYENLDNATVLVTGATGLVGVSLIRALFAIYEKKKINIKIIGLIRDKSKAEAIYGKLKKNSILSFIVADITDEISISEPIDYIFHCASITTSKVMVEKPVETLITAIIGTKHILDIAAEKMVRSFVYVSSMEMYGSFGDESREIKETNIGYIDPLKVRSNYPESKRLCENMCIAYLSEYHVPIKIARLAQTFGAGILPWETRVFAQFAQSVLQGENIVLHTKGKSEGNYCYLRDTILGLFTILFNGKDGEAYNVVNPATHTTIADMAKMVCERIADKKIAVEFDIPENNTFGYAADTKLKLNSDKLQELGWKPEVGLEEAYRRLIESIKVEKTE